MKKYLFLPLFFFLFSCAERRAVSDDIESIVIDLASKNVVRDKAAYNEYRYVKLETTDESLISEISKVVCAEGKIFVLSFLEPTVFIFNEDGRFLSKINQGQGPGEVLSVSDMAVKDRKLYVLDMYKTLKEYDLNGNFIQDKYKFDSNYFSFSFTGNGLFLVDNNIDVRSDYNLCFVPDNGEEKYYLKKKEWSKGFRVVVHNLIKEDYLTWPLSDTIYHVNSDKQQIEPAFYMDFNGKGINLYNEDKPLTNAEMHNINLYAWYVQDFIPIPSGYFFTFKYKDIFYAKKENTSVVIYDKMIENLPNLRASVGYDNHSLIYPLKAYELIEFREEIQDKASLSDEIYKEDISDTDNPFLIWVPIK